MAFTPSDLSIVLMSRELRRATFPFRQTDVAGLVGTIVGVLGEMTVLLFLIDMRVPYGREGQGVPWRCRVRSDLSCRGLGV
jgi:hypothetical protein